MKSCSLLSLSLALFISTACNALSLATGEDSGGNEISTDLKKTLSDFDTYLCRSLDTGKPYAVQFRKNENGLNQSSPEEAILALLDLEGVEASHCESDLVTQVEEDQGNYSNAELETMQVESKKQITALTIKSREHGHGLWRYSVAVQRMAAVVPVATGYSIKGNAPAQLLLPALLLAGVVAWQYSSYLTSGLLLGIPLGGMLFSAFPMKGFSGRVDKLAQGHVNAGGFLAGVLTYLGYTAVDAVSEGVKSGKQE